MARISLTIDDRELRDILAKGNDIARQTTTAMQLRLQRTWGTKVFADAQVMVPEELSTLVASGQRRNVDGGFVIDYGGLASQYAEKQHEDSSLQHTPPTTEFTYEGPFGGDNPGKWNPVGDWKRLVGAVWGKPIDYTGDKSQWRFQSVEYSRRSPRTDHPIKGTATHHWLEGESHSAYESNERPMLQDLIDVGRQFAARQLARA